MSISSRSPKLTKALLAGATALGSASSFLACGGEGGAGTPLPSGGSVAAGGAVATTGGSASGGVNGDGGLTGVGGAIATGGSTTGGAGSVGGSGTGGVDDGVGGANAGGTSSGGAATGGAAAGGTAAGGSEPGTGGGGGGGDFTLPTEPNSIAYTGCSMANNIGNGYKRVGGKVMWNSDNYQTGAMVVQNWTNPSSSSWQLFDQKANANGGKDKIKAVMVQICIFSSRATDDELHDMVNAARQHVNPGTHIFIVGQPQYNAGHQCTLAGTGGAEWTDMKAQELAADPSINEDLSYLGKFMLDASNGEVVTTAGDNCHATNPKGEDALGEQAKEFFGG